MFNLFIAARHIRLHHLSCSCVHGTKVIQEAQSMANRDLYFTACVASCIAGFSMGFRYDMAIQPMVMPSMPEASVSGLISSGFQAVLNRARRQQ